MILLHKIALFEVFNYEEPDVISTGCLRLRNETKQRSWLVLNDWNKSENYFWKPVFWNLEVGDEQAKAYMEEKAAEKMKSVHASVGFRSCCI